MSRHSGEESAVHDLTLDREDREDRACPECGRRMHVRCRRVGSILTLNGPLRLSVRLVQCCDERCEHTKLHGAAQESGYAMPRWAIDAHSPHTGVFTEDEPVGFATATAHAGQLAFHQRHGVMQKPAQKKRILLLNQLKARILNPCSAIVPNFAFLRRFRNNSIAKTGD